MLEKLKSLKNSRHFLDAFPFIILILLLIIFGIGTGGRFFAKANMTGIFNQALITGTATIGIAFIYTTGNLDISIGAVIALGATIGAKLYLASENIAVMIAVTMLVCFLLMAWNSTLSVSLHIKTTTAAIVMTQIYKAIQESLVGAVDITVPFKTCSFLEKGPFRITTLIIYLLIAIIIYNFTPFGRAIRFIGGNENCAAQSGIRKNTYIRLSFLIAGIGVGLSSVYTIIRVGTINTTTAGSMGMDVMLATVLGGMSIFGGNRSKCYAGVLGAITVVVLNKGLLMLGVDNSVVQGIRGVLFLILVYLNSERPDVLPTRKQF